MILYVVELHRNIENSLWALFFFFYPSIHFFYFYFWCLLTLQTIFNENIFQPYHWKLCAMFFFFFLRNIIFKAHPRVCIETFYIQYCRPQETKFHVTTKKNGKDEIKMKQEDDVTCNVSDNILHMNLSEFVFFSIMLLLLFFILHL